MIQEVDNSLAEKFLLILKMRPSSQTLLNAGDGNATGQHSNFSNACSINVVSLWICSMAEFLFLTTN